MRQFFSVQHLCLLVTVLSSAITVADESSVKYFDRHVAPLLAQRCLSCHSGDEAKGRLNLTTQKTALRGGESGATIHPGMLNESLLWQYVESDEMPPKKPLSAPEKNILKNWITNGAVWGTEIIDPFRFSTDERAGTDWWSLQPLKPSVPPTSPNSGWGKNPIDAFVDARRSVAGLHPAPEADRRTLIRRLSFDLLGLPPTPAMINEFLEDTSDSAYEHLTDRLLNSAHYGERWARHWLDIVRFGESNGFEYDQPRDNAWHYRNWVINALNDDMPYTEFVQLQLAGDVLFPNDRQAAAATGFLVAGPHNTTLPANDNMRMTMQQEELEELAGIVGQTFLGLTVNCARCHDHKFDPISQKEYYQFAATLTGVTHGERNLKVKLSPEQLLRTQKITERSAAIRAQVEAIERPVIETIIRERNHGTAPTTLPPTPYAAWNFDGNFNDTSGDLHATASGNAKIEDGCLVVNGNNQYAATTPINIALHEKTLEAWVKLDSLSQRGGGVISIQKMDGTVFDAIVFGEREPQRWMAGSNSFVRTQSFQATEESAAAERFVQIAIVYQADGTIIGYRDGQPYGQAYRPGNLQSYEAGTSQIIFGMRHSPAGGNRMLAGRIQRARLYNKALSAAEVQGSAAAADINYVSRSQLLAQLTPAQRSTLEQLNIETKALETELAAINASQTVSMYACVSTKPGITRLLLRGDVANATEELSPGGLSALAGGSPNFGLERDSADADRRTKLANWITHEDNPLFTRVIVNRLWHYHFGHGLVKTPSDFGFNGGLPSHPELLDWLAQYLKANDYRLKPLHRIIVTSATYRQASRFNAQAAAIDASNQFLWRKSPVRMEAEELRDAILVATHQLDETVGGIGYRDVRHYNFKGSNFYESITEPADKKLRRTIYRFSPRGGSNPFLNTFDCPDPSATTPDRASTTTPLQALSLMNNDLIFDMSDKFAERVKRSAGDNASQQIKLVYEIAYGRPASDGEIKVSTDFVEQHGLPSFCRVILNSNEFLYVR